MAAHNPPSFVFAVVRRSSLWNLANAFLKPVTPGQRADLATRSIEALDSYWAKLKRIYGTDAIIGRWAVALDDDGIDHLRTNLVSDFDCLVESVLSAVPPAATGAC